MYVLKFIYRNLGRFKGRFNLVFVMGVFDGAATFLIPVLLAEFTKNTFSASDFRGLCVGVVVLYLASLGFQWVIRRFGESIGPQFGNYIRLHYFQMLERLSVKEISKQHSGYVLSLINKISDGVPAIFMDIFWDFAKGLANVTLFFYFTAQESFSVAIINLVVLIVFVSIGTYLARKMVPLANDLNKKKASLMESYVDFMANIITVKKMNIYSFVEGKLTTKTDDNYRQITKLQNFHSNRWLLSHALFGIAFLSTIGFLLFQVSTGAMSASILILFVAAYALIRTNMERLTENIKSLIEMKAYIRSLESVISGEQIAYGNTAISDWHEIVFKNVVVRHEGTEKNITIPDLSIRKGDKICIMGKSGQGKTTLLNLIADFVKPDTGVRAVDGIDYAQINQDFFKKTIALVSQETELFNVSLRENMVLGRMGIEDRMVGALDSLDMRDWIHGLDQGLDTVVGEKGARLSAGQKQRINFIRGVLLDRDIIILDEPTSHLDDATEARVVDYIATHLADKTLIIVSHREALKAVCNKCYSMERHTLVAA